MQGVPEVEDEIQQYLNERHIANLVTLNADGSPHAAPVWYRSEDSGLTIIADSSAVKTRNIRRDPRVAVSIANDTSPAKYVLVEGTATVLAEDVGTIRTDMYRRYQGNERGERTARETFAPGRSIVIRVKPTKTIYWNSEDEG